jgi:glycerate-2-kinase
LEVRRLLEGMILRALTAVDPQEAVSRYFLNREGSLFPSESIRKPDKHGLVLISIGKAARAMAAAACEILGEQIRCGIVVEKSVDSGIHLSGEIEVLQGGHPIPDERSLQAGRRIAELVQSSPPESDFLVLISGGGSSLVTLLPEGVELADYQVLNRLMLGSPLPIEQINTVRKHVDLFKGGGLLRLIGRRKSVSLILSDVVSGGLASVASGPTLADESTFQMAVDICRQHGLWEKLPAGICAHLLAGAAGERQETLKPGDPLTGYSTAVEIGSLQHSLTAAAGAAKEMGWEADIREPALIGRVEEAARRISRDVEQIYSTAHRHVLIYGGETTVNPGEAGGVGGRNSHLALLLSGELERFPGVLVCTFATDGEDGNSPACGAVVTSDTFTKARQMGLSAGAALQRFDSYTFFSRIQDAIVTGPSGTNVNDLTFVIIDKPVPGEN